MCLNGGVCAACLQFVQAYKEMRLRPSRKRIQWPPLLSETSTVAYAEGFTGYSYLPSQRPSFQKLFRDNAGLRLSAL